MPAEAKRTRVLVVEDEESFLEALRIGLGREGFAIDVARDGAEALERFEAVEPDIVLLDVMLPREIDAVVGLEVGADDYVTKPYRFRELVARMRSVLRRVNPVDAPAPVEASDSTNTPIEIGNVRIDPGRHEVMVRDEPVDLPLKEFDLLFTLASSAGRVLTRDHLIDEVWGHDYVGDTKTLDVHIKRLRTKIEDDPSNPTAIVTIRGLGYKFAD